MLQHAVKAGREAGLKKAMRTTTDEGEQDGTGSIVERDRSYQRKIFAVEFAEDIMIQLAAAQAPIFSTLVNATDLPVHGRPEEADAIEIPTFVSQHIGMEEPLRNVSTTLIHPVREFKLGPLASFEAG